MSWTTNKTWVVYKDERGIYMWERSEYMPVYKDIDLFVPILFTNKQNIAMRTARKLNNTTNNDKHDNL